VADAGPAGRPPAEPTFAPAAEAEFLAAIRYYARQRPGFGAAFLAAVEASVAKAAAAPEAGAPLGGHIRRRLVPGFPYQVVYRTDTAPLRVLAVAHLRRRPDYWERRW
jgi:plasmid stabilization system protein ParE